MLPKWMPDWRDLGLFCVAGVLSLGLVELLLRLLGLGWPVPWQNHPDRGLSRPPGLEWIQEHEGRAQIQINRRGFRSQEIEIEKPDGTLRVAVLGDSYTEALQVPEEQRFSEVAESELTHLLGRPVQVLNFGMEGYGTAQELMTFRADAKQYRPDVVVLQVFAANDIRNNSRALEGDPSRPYFVLQDGELELDTSFRSYNGTWFRHYGMQLVQVSRLAQFAYMVRGRIRLHRILKRAQTSEEQTGQDDVIPLNAGLDDEVFRPPSDSEWTDAWSVTEALIEQLHSEVSAAGALLMIIAVPHAVETHPSVEVRSRYASDVGVDDLSYANRRLEALGERLGIPILGLASTLGEHALETGQYLCGFSNTKLGWGHFNADGHRIIGQFTAVEIARILAESP